MKKNESHPVHLFRERNLSWRPVSFVFRERKNNIWRLNASDALSYEWNSEKLYFLILYLVQKKNIWEWAVFFHIITIALGSYWQTVTEMRASLRKKKTTVLVAIDIYRWMKMKGEGTNLLKMRNFKGIQLINASWGSLEEQINSNPEGNSKLKNDNAAKKLGSECETVS